MWVWVGLSKWVAGTVEDMQEGFWNMCRLEFGGCVGGTL